MPENPWNKRVTLDQLIAQLETLRQTIGGDTEVWVAAPEEDHEIRSPVYRTGQAVITDWLFQVPGQPWLPVEKTVVVVDAYSPGE